MVEKKKKSVVVGSGIAGIAAAIRLANKGYSVDVYEANSYPGGKLTSLELGRYRFDAARGHRWIRVDPLCRHWRTAAGEA